jgi:hypothetical protein
MNKNTGVNKMKIGDKVMVKWHKQHEMWIGGCVVVGFTPKRIKVDMTWALDSTGKEVHIQKFIPHNVELEKGTA